MNERMPITNALYGTDHPKFRKGTTQPPEPHHKVVHEQLDEGLKKKIQRKYPRTRFTFRQH